MGDASDNIPGVKGIGEKTEQRLLLRFGSVARIAAASEEELAELVWSNLNVVVSIPVVRCDADSRHIVVNLRGDRERHVSNHIRHWQLNHRLVHRCGKRVLVATEGDAIAVHNIL